MTKSPSLSVIIASYNSLGTIGRCLDSLHLQKTDNAFEILLVDSSSDGTADFVKNHYPNVRVIPSPRRLYCGDARNRAIPLAQAPIIAFLDADCYVEGNWVDAVCQAHNDKRLLAGGIIDNAPTRNLISWAYYFCEFNLWMPSRKTRPVAEIAGCCLSLKRIAYDRYGPFLKGTYCSDTAFQWKTQQEGGSVIFSPAIRVYHQSPGHFRYFLIHIFDHRRDFARVACCERHLTWKGRIAAMAILPAIPFLLMVLTLIRLRFCWSYLPRFMAASPLVFLGYIARSCGEFAGYLRPTK